MTRKRRKEKTLEDELTNKNEPLPVWTGESLQSEHFYKLTNK